MPSGTRKTKPLTRRGGQPPTEPAPVARRPALGVPLAGDEPRVAASGAGQCRSGSRHTVGNHLRVPVKAADGDVLMPCRPKRASSSNAARRRRTGLTASSASGSTASLQHATSRRSSSASTPAASARDSARGRRRTTSSTSTPTRRTGSEASSKRDGYCEGRGAAGKRLAALRSATGRTTTGCQRETRARWEWKLRVLEWLATLYPLTDVVVEDIRAETRKGARKWNARFSPLESGKRWFYARIEERWSLTTRQGHETATLREQYGLKKSSNKTSERWNAHCVDAWTLAESVLAASRPPEHERIVRIRPIRRQRRCLHRANPSKGGQRSPYGGTNRAASRPAPS